MKRRLLDYLVCLYCKYELVLIEPVMEGAEIIAGKLLCKQCRRNFPIQAGIPRLLPDELSQEKQATAAGFGYSWKAFAHLDEAYEQQFLDWIAPITREFFDNKLVLDAGCGKGRHAWCAARFGAREVIGLDLSEAVEVAYHNTRDLENVHIVQGDIYNLPFRVQFDYIYSVGVLHHLPDPAAGFLALTRVLHKGGTISAWVYGRENNGWITYFVNPFRERIAAKMPRALLRLLSWSVTALLLYPALKLVYRPINLMLPGLAKLLFYNDYMFYISKFSFRDIYSIVLDHLIAPTAFYLRREEFASWFETAQLDKVQINWHNRNSWRGMGMAD
ncbi:MAG: methyltransferase domain-containing protein [Acidobacteriota bacterium]